MNIADIILIIVIVLAFAVAVSCIVKNMKKGKCCSGCGGACSGCRYSGTEKRTSKDAASGRSQTRKEEGALHISSSRQER